nr:restriction endonuclease subunit S [uncultured Halomonas sp.]
MSNAVPEGWQIRSIGDLVTLQYGKSPKDVIAGGGEYPVIGTGGVTGYASSYLYDGCTTVIGRKGTINKPSYVEGKFWAIDTTYFGTEYKAAEPKWFYYSLNSFDLSKYNEASGVPSLGRDTLNAIPLLTPPLPEQQKIAAILSSVDNVIVKTRAQIDKLKDLKTGMMQELLTKGIGHTEFKDSPVGRIPASWVVKTVGDLGSVVTGSTPKTASREYYGGSIPFISPSDINHSMYIRKTVNSLTEAGLKETRELPAGTVCVVCIGSTIGKTGITTFRCATNQQVNAVICRGTHPEFVYYLLTYYSKVIKAEAGTQAVPIINKSSFSALPVQLPGYDEQVEIGNSIASVDTQTSLLESKLQSANSLKKALMQDLLTGKVRVKVDQKESAVA